LARGRPAFVLSCAIVRRVSVVGNSGSGKSTLAKSLALVLGVPHVELDGVFHQPGWVPLPEDEFRRAVAAAVAGDGWVTDGNYSAVRPLVWARADTVVWLDLPRRTVMRQVVWRTARRAFTREELWNGNREPWSNLWSLKPEKSIIAWTATRHGLYRRRYAAAEQDLLWAGLRFARLRSQAEADRFVASLRSAPAEEE
jgi:adenylate kinase family enzyme